MSLKNKKSGKLIMPMVTVRNSTNIKYEISKNFDEITKLLSFSATSYRFFFIMKFVTKKQSSQLLHFLL